MRRQRRDNTNGRATASRRASTGPLAPAGTISPHRQRAKRGSIEYAMPLRMEAELGERMEAAARRAGLTRSAWVREAISEKLERSRTDATQRLPL